MNQGHFSQGMTVAAAMVAVMAYGIHGDGFVALALPLLASGLGIALARERRWRLIGSVMGGTIASACVWFVNFFLRTSITIFGRQNPFMEAMGGAVAGAAMGLLLGIPFSIDYRQLRCRFTIRGQMIAVVFLALTLFLVTSFIRADRGVRVLMVIVAVVVGAPALILFDLRRRSTGSANPLEPESQPGP